MTTAATVRRVALTFDAEHPDRPASPGNEARLLDTLAGLGIRATFFVQGRWAEAQPRLARRIADAGHLVGSHSHYHVRLPLLTDDGVADDIRTAETAIVDATGAGPRPWFRCPFGAGMDDPRILAAIGAAGYRHVAWDVTAEDWDPDRTAADVEQAIVDGTIARGDGAVVLLHAWPDQMLEALPAIASRLAADGWSFVRLDALERVPEMGPAIDELAAESISAPPGAGA